MLPPVFRSKTLSTFFPSLQLTRGELKDHASGVSPYISIQDFRENKTEKLPTAVYGTPAQFVLDWKHGDGKNDLRDGSASHDVKNSKGSFANGAGMLYIQYDTIHFQLCFLDDVVSLYACHNLIIGSRYLCRFDPKPTISAILEVK